MPELVWLFKVPLLVTPPSEIVVFLMVLLFSLPDNVHVVAMYKIFVAFLMLLVSPS